MRIDKIRVSRSSLGPSVLTYSSPQYRTVHVPSVLRPPTVPLPEGDGLSNPSESSPTPSVNLGKNVSRPTVSLRSRPLSVTFPGPRPRSSHESPAVVRSYQSRICLVVHSSLPVPGTPGFLLLVSDETLQPSVTSLPTLVPSSYDTTHTKDLLDSDDTLLSNVPLQSLTPLLKPGGPTLPERHTTHRHSWSGETRNLNPPLGSLFLRTRLTSLCLYFRCSKPSLHSLSLPGCHRSDSEEHCCRGRSLPSDSDQT